MTPLESATVNNFLYCGGWSIESEASADEDAFRLKWTKLLSGFHCSLFQNSRKTHCQLVAWHGNDGDCSLSRHPVEMFVLKAYIWTGASRRISLHSSKVWFLMITPILNPDWSSLDWVQHSRVIEHSILWLSWQNWWKDVWLWCCSVSTS